MLRLYPSMMCADFDHLADEVTTLSETQIDGFHMDIMDGSFVPNFGLSPEDFKTVADHTTKLIDAHFMIWHPENYIEKFVNLGAKRIYFHPETTANPVRVIDQINNLGAEPCIAISPGVSIASVSELLQLVDRVLVMTVNPGFSGQKYLDFVNEKLKKLIQLFENRNHEIVVDGAISPEKIQSLSSMGVSGFILGTSSLFGKQRKYVDIIHSLRQIGVK